MGDNGWVQTEPGTPMFSTALMVAEEYFDGERWLAIYDRSEVTNAALHAARWRDAANSNKGNPNV